MLHINLLNIQRQVLYKIFYVKRNFAILIAVCNVTTHQTPIFTCENDVLAISWITDTAYAANVPAMPADVKGKLTQALIQRQMSFPIVLLSKTPP